MAGWGKSIIFYQSLHLSLSCSTWLFIKTRVKGKCSFFPLYFDSVQFWPLQPLNQHSDYGSLESFQLGFHQHRHQDVPGDLPTFSAIRVALIPLVNLVSAHMMIKSNIVVVGLVRLTISAKTGRVLFSIFGKTGRWGLLPVIHVASQAKLLSLMSFLR